MRELRDDIARRVHEVRQSRFEWRIEKALLQRSVHDSVASPKVMAGAFLVGFSAAMLRCRGKSDSHTDQTRDIPARSMDWLFRNILPPIMMAVMQRFWLDGGHEAGDEPGHAYGESGPGQGSAD